MHHYSMAPGAADQTVYVFIPDARSSVGAGLTGVVYNAAGLTCYYVRTRGAAAQLSLATLAAADSAHSDGGFKEVDATNQPGVYRLDVSDAIVAAGAADAYLHVKGAANAVPVSVHIRLASYILTTGYVASDAKAVNASTAAAARLALSAGQMIPGTVNDANTAPSATVFAAADITEATADHFKSRIVLWTTGALTGQVTDVTAYALDTGEGKFTVTAMTDTPADGDTFILI